MILFPKAQALQEALMMIGHENERCTLTQLHGFLFGLAVTPDNIPNKEWEAYIFKDMTPDDPKKDKTRPLIEQAAEDIVTQVNNTTFEFPLQYQQPTGLQIKEIIEWSSGLQASLLLRSPLWLGKEQEQASEEQKQTYQEMSFCFASLRAITKPSDIPTLFGQDSAEMSGDEKMRLFVKCLQSMPHLVQSLMNFSQKHKNA
ncbi:MAG: UPF0149 family protein [Mariprofundaceae bacterium]|nr:UPF0149 family protein [Mariprofundaceae bacterium]